MTIELVGHWVLGLQASLPQLQLPLHRDPPAHHLVRLILDDLLDVVVPEGPTAVH